MQITPNFFLNYTESAAESAAESAETSHSIADSHSH